MHEHDYADETDSESVDIDDLIAKKTLLENILPYFNIVVSLVFSILRLWVSWFKKVWQPYPTRLGEITPSSNTIKVVHEKILYTLFIPKTTRVTPQGTVERYLPKAEIREVSILTDEEEIVWTKEFLGLAGPHHNFFGMAVNLATIYNTKGLKNPKIRIALKDDEKVSQVIFNENETIDIFEYRSV